MRNIMKDELPRNIDGKLFGKEWERKVRGLMKEWHKKSANAKNKRKMKSSGTADVHEPVTKKIKALDAQSNQARRTHIDVPESSNSKKSSVRCFSCRQVGHRISECPNMTHDSQIKVCYYCGSTEHFSSKCKKQNPDSAPFATCFVCHEKGHLSSRCPQNPNGIYVNGGSCNGCGSTKHLFSNCPERKNHKRNNESETEIVAFKQTDKVSADSIELDIAADGGSEGPTKSTRKSAVVFF